MTQGESADRLFRFVAFDQSGRKVSDQIRATDRRQAMRALSLKGLTATSLSEAVAEGSTTKQGKLSFTDRVSVLRQLALMVDAGVGLLEAVDTVGIGIVAKDSKTEFENLSRDLKQGSTFAAAMEADVAGFPFYVYAMIRVGEATGQLNTVLQDAANQMAYEDRLRREFANAMTYPAFLASAGLLAVFFIFTQVVPRFSVMIGDKRANLPVVSRLVIETGEFASQHILMLLVAIAGLIGGLAFAALNPSLRKSIYQFGHSIPLVRDLLRYREITTWARLTGFALRNGVGLLEASDLARLATPDGRFRSGLEQFERDLKVGMAVDESLGRHTPLTAMDLSLLRVGQRSGTLGKMFDFLADGYDAKLSDAMKRLTSLIEPIAIGFISILVGIVALSLVLALSSVYDTVL